MENASKALIIAGAIMVSIMVVSLGVFVFNKFGGSAKKIANMDEQEVSAFNSKITPYVGDSISGSQVNALLQYCLSNNMAATNSGETYKQIEVIDCGKASSLAKTDDKYNRVETAGKYYTVEATYDSNGLITQLNIKQKTTNTTNTTNTTSP